MSKAIAFTGNVEVRFSLVYFTLCINNPFT